MVAMGSANRNKILANGFLPFWKMFWLLCSPTLAVRGEAEPTFQMPSESHGRRVGLTGTEACFGEKGEWCQCLAEIVGFFFLK